ncbi:MAG: Alpha-L-fucosidase [Lentisphaerae bacterium ADurb.BinA184]|nr:MAG: Alpha-L-fucosidase [Lentisphaerae bacterium ADurb.BinA184]
MNETRTWLNDSIMNLLVDYYTEVQFRPYGSGASRRNTVHWLKQLKLGYLCIYAKGHSGYTSWDSSLKTRHNRLGQDMCRLFRDVTREAGCRLVLYYSGLLDGIAGDRHPDWRMKNLDGTDKECLQDFKCFHSYGNCPLSGYFDEWVAIQLRELIGQYDPDGFWFDGDWPGPCYCPRCQARFREQTGWDGPWGEIVKRPDFHAAYQPVWNRTESEWRERCSRLIKSCKPDCIYSAGNVSPRREFLGPFDWRSGDFFSPGFFNLHDMARMMRWYGTLGVPYDAYVCDTSFTHVRKDVRSRSKTVERMMQEAATVAANGGAVGYWTYPTGNGALVPSRMRKAIAVREFLAEREGLFLHSRSASRTAIVVSDPASPVFGGNGAQGAHKALAAVHRSPDLMDESGLVEGVPYDLVVLPEQPQVDPATVKRLDAFVRGGGTLLTSGGSILSPGSQELLGVKAVKRGAVADGHVFLKQEPFGEPVGIDFPWDWLELGTGTEELYALYRSWDDLNPECRNLANNWPMHGQVDEEKPEPAGCAAALVRRLGKGTIVHVATDIFGMYLRLGDPQMLRWIREIVHELDPDPLLATNAPSWVDVSPHRAADGRLLVHFVNQNSGRDVAKLGTDDTWVDEIPEVGPYSCGLRIASQPQTVTWEPGGQPLDWSWRDGRLQVTLPRFHIHGCLAVGDGGQGCTAGT